MLAAALATASSAAAQTTGTTISGPDLPHSVSLAAVDDDAFRRRLQPPPQLEAPPAVEGEPYAVVSDYWADALRDGQGSDAVVEPEGAYYPQGGHVRLRVDGADLWLLLDVRQRAILDRYIRLTAADAISGGPASFEVLRAAAPSEPIAIMVGARILTETEADAFWQVAGLALRGDIARAGAVVEPGLGSTWITFSLSEGRSLQYLYQVGGGVLLDFAASEFYAVPNDWLVPVLGPSAAPGPGFAFGPVQIEEEGEAGSPVWWVVMIGAGVACVAAAVWLRRRLASTEAK
jgi:hypothetical protein